jgi:hypothetical protein
MGKYCPPGAKNFPEPGLVERVGEGSLRWIGDYRANFDDFQYVSIWHESCSKNSDAQFNLAIPAPRGS